MTRNTLHLAVLLSVVGCSDGSGTLGAPATRDSAGIAITEIPGRLAETVPRWQLAPNPDLRVGAVDGSPDYLFHLARSPLTLPDGRIAVLDGGDSAVRFYSSAGEFLGRSGGQGSGPGEFEDVSAMTIIAGDSLLIWDRRLGRATIMDDHGKFGRIITIRTLRLNETFLGALQNGDFFLQWVQRIRGGSAGDQRRIIVRVGPQTVDTVYVAPLPVKPLIAFGEPDFRTPIFTPDPLTVAAGGSLWLNWSGAFEVSRADASAKVLASTRLALPRTPVTPDLFDRYADSVVFQGPWPREEKPELRRIYDELGYADSIPAVDRILHAGNGRIWLRRARYIESAEATREWLVLEPGGSITARAYLPARVNPAEIGEDYVLAVERDSLDVQYVAKYRIIK